MGCAATEAFADLEDHIYVCWIAGNAARFLAPDLDEAAFRALLDQFERDKSLTAADQKRVAQEVTKAGAARLSNKDNRVAELRRWFVARGRHDARMNQLTAGLRRS